MSMNENTDDAMQLLEADRVRDPRKAPFGVCVSDVDVAGISMFAWYSTEADRQRALLDRYHRISDSADTWPDVRPTLTERLADLSPLQPETSDQLDQLTGDHYRIEWWGTFDELRAGQHELAVELRERLRPDADDQVAPVEDDEVDCFVELIAHYGF